MPDKLSPLSENSHIMLTKEFTLEGVELLMVLDPLSFTFWSFFLLLIVPGFIAAIVYKEVCKVRQCGCCWFVSYALIFDLLILIINFFGLFWIKGIKTIFKLLKSFECLQFTAKYGLLAIFVGVLLALIVCAIQCCYKKYCRK